MIMHIVILALIVASVMSPAFALFLTEALPERERSLGNLVFRAALLLMIPVGWLLIITLRRWGRWSALGISVASGACLGFAIFFLLGGMTLAGEGLVPEPTPRGVTNGNVPGGITSLLTAAGSGALALLAGWLYLLRFDGGSDGPEART